METTPSTIGILRRDGSIECITCGTDGYWNGVGRTLFEYYPCMDLVEELLAHGQLINLGQVIGIALKERWPDQDLLPYDTDRLGDDNLRVAWPPVPMCNFYRRDTHTFREWVTKSQHYPDLKHFEGRSLGPSLLSGQTPFAYLYWEEGEEWWGSAVVKTSVFNAGWYSSTDWFNYAWMPLYEHDRVNWALDMTRYNRGG